MSADHTPGPVSAPGNSTPGNAAPADAVPYAHVGVLGAGAWGTALAQSAARIGREVTLWCRRDEVATSITARRENIDRLPGVTLDERLRATAKLAQAADADVLIAVAPAQHTRALLASLSKMVAPGTPVVLCAKGLERETLAFMSDVAGAALPRAVPAVLSGPSFAHDVGAGLPTAVTLACADADIGARLVATLGQPALRPYLTDDVIGAEVGGAVKNVLAIGCGVVAGRRLGASAHAALVTRGFAEMRRLGAALGARVETLNGLCGFGDLVLTCSNQASRNMSLGHALGQGRRLADILAERTAVSEGVASAPAITALAARHDVDMPICAAVDAILAERASIDEAIEGLLSRPFKAEAL